MRDCLWQPVVPTVSRGGGGTALDPGSFSAPPPGRRSWLTHHALIHHALWLLALLWLPGLAHAGMKDVPFKQAVSTRFTAVPELEGARFQRVCLERNGIVYVLTDRGVARLFGDRLALDKSFRPLAGRKALDLTAQHGQVFYLFEDQYLCNGLAGKILGNLPKGVYRRLAVAEDFSVLLAGQTNLLLIKGGQAIRLPFAVPRQEERLYATGNQFVVQAGDAVYRVAGASVELVHRARNLTALGFRGGQTYLGTREGYYGMDWFSGKANLPLQTKLPAAEVTCLAPATNGLWIGTSRGLVFQSGPGRFRYFASKRWLADDEVVDLQPTRAGDVYVLTRTGLTKIEFQTMTLAQKAAYYQRRIRERHIRYGLCAELRLSVPGDPTSAEMVDTDNDGTWSSYYLASQAFRYAVTGEEEARAHAWETFEALERLQTINPLEGFPARTFERKGFKVSDPERWHLAPDPAWEWKAHTSSDEITAQTFAHAVLYETAARTQAERARIAAGYQKIVDHILRHNYYLVDVDGQPTLWGRWNPEYVNHYPPTIGDRRLNSAEIIAFLQFAHKITGKEIYRQKAYDLMDQQGYRENITNSMSRLTATPGFVFRNNEMGNEWNHSDDLLAFVNYWTLYRYAFTEELRRLYAAAIRDHWEIESVERCPLWNFVYAMSGGSPWDLEGALWTLQRFPLDLVSWSVHNSHRADLTRLPDNFRHQQSKELLAPDERPLMRWNGNPFVLDGGDSGSVELAGDEFLLPYWMGRYLRLIE